MKGGGVGLGAGGAEEEHEEWMLHLLVGDHQLQGELRGVGLLPAPLHAQVPDPGLQLWRRVTPVDSSPCSLLSSSWAARPPSTFALTSQTSPTTASTTTTTIPATIMAF